jgi:flagellar basal-body rod protein FlgB
MINELFSQPNYVGSKKLLDATVMRQQAIASNLANLEKPNYKRIDLDPGFRTELQRAVASKNVDQISSLQPKLALDSKAVPNSKDGNTVKLEEELIQLSQNTLEHTLGTQLVTGNLLKLRLAITGRAS